MPAWVPVAVLIAIWVAVVISLLWQWYRYAQAARRGAMRKEDLTTHITADVISLGVAVGIALLINGWVAGWLNEQRFVVSDWILYTGYLLVAVVIATIISRLYHRLVDTRVRKFLMNDPDNQTHASESES